MQLEREKTEKLFERLSPKEKLEFISKSILSGLIKEQKDTDYWKSKIPPEEAFEFNLEVEKSYKEMIMNQIELNQAQAEIRIKLSMLVAKLVDKNHPEKAEQLREQAKDATKYFGVGLEKIKESIKN
jgi:hypothetical protein